jgi:hypothetical protein
MPENWQKATKAPKVLKIKNSRNLTFIEATQKK